MIRENGVPPSAAHGFDVYFEVSYIKGQVEIGLKSQAGLVLFTVDLTAWWGGAFIKFAVKRALKQDQTLHMEGKLQVILYFREECIVEYI